MTMFIKPSTVATSCHSLVTFCHWALMGTQHKVRTKYTLWPTNCGEIYSISNFPNFVQTSEHVLKIYFQVKIYVFNENFTGNYVPQSVLQPVFLQKLFLISFFSVKRFLNSITFNQILDFFDQNSIVFQMPNVIDFQDMQFVFRSANLLLVSILYNIQLR